MLTERVDWLAILAGGRHGAARPSEDHGRRACARRVSRPPADL